MIVKHHPINDFIQRLTTSSKLPSIQPALFQRTPQAFSGRVIAIITFATHKALVGGTTYLVDDRISKHDEREQEVEDRALYAQEEYLAQNDRLGLWNDKKPMPPWDFRKIPH